jgi:hypothetical protein
MIGPATGFLMAIMGCGEADAQCQQVQLAPLRYETRAACVADSEAQIARQTDVDYPVVVAECRAAANPVVALRADEVRLPEPQPLRRAVQTASKQR